ncbi:MAG: S8 family serine peptidase [Phycisphaerae bacterium]|jgi:hypothetical protein
MRIARQPLGRQSAAALLLCAGAAHGDVVAPAEDVSPPRAGVLHLRTGGVERAGLTDLMQAAGDTRLPREPVVITLTGPMTRFVRADLTAAGVTLHGYLPRDAYLASLPEWTVQAARDAGLVANVYRFDDAWKIAPELLQDPALTAWRHEERRADAKQGDAWVTLALMPGAAAPPAIDALNKIAGARHVNTSVLGEQRVLDAVVPFASMDALRALPGLQMAEPAADLAVRSNTLTRWVLQSNQVNVESIYARGITGVGQILGVIDDPLDLSHCSLADSNPVGPTHRKVLAYNAPPNLIFPHGMHVTVTALGDSGDASDRRGVAYGAKLVFGGIPAFGEQFVYDALDLHRTQGAFLHNNSWGNDSTTAYDTTTRAVDRFVRDHEEHTVVFSVSNENTVRNPENAKNILGIAGSRNYPTQDASCVGGVGPTADGRRKPDLMTPGCGITSAALPTDGENCGVVTFPNGASFAAPSATGSAALVRQYFTDGYFPTGIATAGNGFIPSAALVRATLLNGAADMTAVQNWPNMTEGWGRVLIDNALWFNTPTDTRRLVLRDIRNSDPRALENFEGLTYFVDVTDSTQPLKVTLTWTDQAAELFSSVAIVNDLDLVVTSPTGITYLGNNFTVRFSVAGGVADARNLVEQINLPTPVTGRWAVSVVASNVPMGPQGFALVTTGSVRDVTCNDIDFNNDLVSPSDQDVIDFFNVLAGGPCSSGNCDSIDFNNDGVYPSEDDVMRFLAVFSGEGC